MNIKVVIGGVVMVKHRQDAWTLDEDKLLAETVITHIRTGSTQIKAFEEVGKLVNRTAAACGFRWNSYIRRLYKDDITKAKKEKKERLSPSSSEQLDKLENPVKENKNAHSLPLLEDMLSYVQTLYKDAVKGTQLQSELEQYREKMKELERQLLHVTRENEKLSTLARKTEEENQTLLAIMERARQMVLREEDKIK